MAGIMGDKIIKDFAYSAEGFKFYLMCNRTSEGSNEGVLRKVWPYGGWVGQQQRTKPNKLHVIFNFTLRP